MKAIIPVAGHGTRLEPHTLSLQKCLFPVAGKPVLQHIIDKLINVDIVDITLIIGHLGEQVRGFCEKFDNINFSFVEQTERLGLGHAIQLGLEATNDPVLIVLGDSILELDYFKFISSNTSSLGVKKVPDPERFGIVELSDDKIVSVIEKPAHPLSDLALIGIYFITSQNYLNNGIKHLIDNSIKTNDEYQLTDAFSIMINDKHEFSAFEIDDCLDCGVPETVFSTNKKLLSRGNLNSIDSSAIIENSKLAYCSIAKDCVIIDSILHNVIMLPGGRVVNQKIENKIIGFNQEIENPR